jgi:hypothetical protein
VTKSELWPSDSPAAIAHINMLQGIIARLAGNSASCKTWCLTLVAALLSFAAGVHAPRLAAFAIVPVFVFLLLDSTYLAQEQAYRELFKRIIGKMRGGSYGLADAYEAAAPIARYGVLRAFKSWSIWPFYLSLALAYAVAMWSGWVASPPAPVEVAQGAPAATAP